MKWEVEWYLCVQLHNTTHCPLRRHKIGQVTRQHIMFASMKTKSFIRPHFRADSVQTRSTNPFPFSSVAPPGPTGFLRINVVSLCLISTSPV